MDTPCGCENPRPFGPKVASGWWLVAGKISHGANLPADWYLVASPLLTVLTKILRFVETLQRSSKSAEVGPRRTMVSFIGMLTLVHPFATTWHFSTGKHVTGFAGRGAPL